MQHRFIIIGATGYAGSAVVSYLCDKKIETIAHIRPDSSNLEKAKKRFSHLGAKIDTTEWSASAFREMLLQHQPTHVFSMLGTTQARAKKDAKSGKDSTYEHVDRDLSLLLLHALEDIAPKLAEQHNQPPRYLFLSSIGVVDDTKNRYLRARADVEREVRQANIPWIIAQPSFISGPDRPESRPLERFGSIVVDAITATLSIVGIKGPYQKYGTLSAAQLAAGLVELSLDETCYNKTLDTTAIRPRIPSGI